jgi:hypothetical protein
VGWGNDFLIVVLNPHSLGDISFATTQRVDPKLFAELVREGKPFFALWGMPGRRNYSLIRPVTGLRMSSGVFGPYLVASVCGENGTKLWEQSISASSDQLQFFCGADVFPDALLMYDLLLCELFQFARNYFGLNEL